MHWHSDKVHFVTSSYPFCAFVVGAHDVAIAFYLHAGSLSSFTLYPSWDHPEGQEFSLHLYCNYKGEKLLNHW